LSQQPSPTITQKKPIRKDVLIAVLVMVGVALVILALVVIPILNSPKPEITVLTGYESFQGLNYVFKVDVTVKNNGAEGTVTVHAQINGAGRYETQEQSIHLDSSESKSLQFVFDISLWGSLTQPSISYKAWCS
jgi:hypothetical protein